MESFSRLVAWFKQPSTRGTRLLIWLVGVWVTDYSAYRRYVPRDACRCSVCQEISRSHKILREKPGGDGPIDGYYCIMHIPRAQCEDLKVGEFKVQFEKDFSRLRYGFLKEE
ncbi:hypothetical protein TWF718_010291 [Orbilia javanica]|uniref:Uncharacterized protein n=1 Tax=Orbilia javanica TaxID=47235 RepID=A0AAN8MU63_9PEZI